MQEKQVSTSVEVLQQLQAEFTAVELPADFAVDAEGDGSAFNQCAPLED